MDRRINAAGLLLVKKWEGLRLTAYRDSVGVLTIGYGHTGRDVKPGMTIDEAEAERLLRADLAEAESAVSRLITVPLTDNQFAALVAFTFNVGTGAMTNSTLRKRLNAGDYGAVPGQLRLWVNGGGRKLTGLVNRRNAEIKLWSTPDAPDVVAHTPQPAPAPAPRPVPVPSPKPNRGAMAAVIMAPVIAAAYAVSHVWTDFWHWIGSLFN